MFDKRSHETFLSILTTLSHLDSRATNETKQLESRSHTSRYICSDQIRLASDTLGPISISDTEALPASAETESVPESAGVNCSDFRFARYIPIPRGRSHPRDRGRGTSSWKNDQDPWRELYRGLRDLLPAVYQTGERLPALGYE